MASEDLAEAAGGNCAIEILVKFDPLIRRSSRRASFYLIGSCHMAEDLGQDVRLQLVRALESYRIEHEPLIRHFITNAVRDRIRFEQRRIQLGSQATCELDDRIPVFAATDAALRPEVLSVANWVAKLPDRLRAVFELIYRSGCTQREVSNVLGLSQPRITQLHQELLQRGRIELSAPSA